LRQFTTAFLEELATVDRLRCNRLALGRFSGGLIGRFSRAGVNLTTLVGVVSSYLRILDDFDNYLFARLLVVLDVVADL
jgi:hypothetical protein